MEKYQRELLRDIRSGRPLSEADFDRYALRTYRFQRSRNKIYDRFCEASGAGEVRRWQDVPALPVAAFKHHRVACFPRSRTLRTFLTSGTSRGGAARGRHEFEDLSFYDAAIRSSFPKHVLRGLARGERVRFVLLTAAPATARQSSLSYMGERAARMFGQGKPFRAVTSRGLRAAELTEHLSACVFQNKKVLLFATTFALADYLDRLTEAGTRLRLPAGSRVMETGGYKGRRKEVRRSVLLARIGERLGIPPGRVINEYGMTELSSQFYGGPASRTSGPAVQHAAAWVRVVVADPETGRPLPAGRTGAVRVYDLANQGSCFAVQTEDLGRRTGAGFELLGRMPEAVLRGCSLAFEELTER